jgi:hypothetical protein
MNRTCQHSVYGQCQLCLQQYQQLPSQQTWPEYSQTRFTDESAFWRECFLRHLPQGVCSEAERVLAVDAANKDVAAVKKAGKL